MYIVFYLPDMTLCDEQDVKIQLLTDKLLLIISTFESQAPNASLDSRGFFPPSFFGLSLGLAFPLLCMKRPQSRLSKETLKRNFSPLNPL